MGYLGYDFMSEFLLPFVNLNSIAGTASPLSLRSLLYLSPGAQLTAARCRNCRVAQCECESRFTRGSEMFALQSLFIFLRTTESRKEGREGTPKLGTVRSLSLSLVRKLLPMRRGGGKGLHCLARFRTCRHHLRFLNFVSVSSFCRMGILWLLPLFLSHYYAWRCGYSALW